MVDSNKMELGRGNWVFQCISVRFILFHSISLYFFLSSCQSWWWLVGEQSEYPRERVFNSNPGDGNKLPRTVCPALLRLPACEVRWIWAEGRSESGGIAFDSDNEVQAQGSNWHCHHSADPNMRDMVCRTAQIEAKSIDGLVEKALELMKAPGLSTIQCMAHWCINPGPSSPVDSKSRRRVTPCQAGESLSRKC
jgi:hypothetical protein